MDLGCSKHKDAAGTIAGMQHKHMDAAHVQIHMHSWHMGTAHVHMHDCTSTASTWMQLAHCWDAAHVQMHKHG